MARSILNSMSTIEIVLLGVGGMVVLTLVAVVLVRRLYPGSPTASSSRLPRTCGSSTS